MRRVGGDGCVNVDLEPYYIGKQWAGQYVTLHVHGLLRIFSVWHGTTEIKELSIKNLVGRILPLQEFLDLMTDFALSDCQAFAAPPARIAPTVHMVGEKRPDQRQFKPQSAVDELSTEGHLCRERWLWERHFPL